MAGELVVMSARELDRLAVIKQVRERRLTRVKAGEIMQLGLLGEGRKPPMRTHRDVGSGRRTASARVAIPPPPAPPDRAERLATALWFTDTFHTAETERIKQWNEAVCRVQALEASIRNADESSHDDAESQLQSDRRRTSRSG